MPQSARTSLCSLEIDVDLYWHARPDVEGQDEHIRLLVEVLVAVVKAVPGRRWNPYNEAAMRSEFRRRLVAASEGRLVPVDHVKSIEHQLAAEMFEIRWQGITVTRQFGIELRHEDIGVRLLHAEPGSLGVVALGLHAHEKVVVPGDSRATRTAQDHEIVTATNVLATALPAWLRRSPAKRLDRSDGEV